MLTRAFTFIRFKKISLILIFFSLISCDLLYNEGDWITEKRNISAFNNINLNCIADIYYHYSPTASIEVSYYQNELTSIKTYIDDSTLIIENNFNGQWFTDIQTPRIDVYTPTINYFSIEEAGGFYCIDTIYTNSLVLDFDCNVFESDVLIHSDKLLVRIHATGKLTLNGYSRYSKIKNIGEVKIYGQNLKTQIMEIIHQSFIDANFYVTQHLNYKIVRRGNLIIYGNPAYTNGIELDAGKLVLKNEK